MSNLYKNPFERLKKVTVTMLSTVYMMFFMALGCGIQNPEENGDYIPIIFYEGDIIPIKQVENKIFIQHVAPSIELNLNTYDEYWEQWSSIWEQWLILIGSEASLVQHSVSGDWALLEAKNGETISQAIIEYFKESPVVAKVSFPLESEQNEILYGLRNEFAVKLKETTSMEQLKQLAAQNHCTVSTRETGNHHFVSVHKTSELDAMQMSELFRETNLFETVQPSYVVFNLPGVYCDNRIVLKRLEDEPAYIRKNCFDHLERKEGFFFELVNQDFDFYSLGGLITYEEIPKQYRKGGLSVKISGNVTSCTVGGGCSEPNIKLASIPIFEIKSIKINN